MEWLGLLLRKRLSFLMTMGFILMTASASYGATTITVNTKDTAGAAVFGSWSIDGGATWFASGATATSGAGTYTITFGNLPGYTKPADFVTAALLDPSANNYNATGVAEVPTVSAAGYAAVTNPGNPGLHAAQINMTVTLTPTQVATDGARWSLDGGTVWYTSGQTVSAPSSYTITFKSTQTDDVTPLLNLGWRTPRTITGTSAAGPVTVTMPYQHVVNDYDKNGKSDVLFRNGTTGDLYAWDMNGATVSSGGIFSTSPGLPAAAPGAIVGQSDFDGDGKTDLLFEDSTTSPKTLRIWYMSGKTVSGTATLTISPVRTTTEVVGGVADFNGDGRADIMLIETLSTGALTPRMLLGNGTSTPTSSVTSVTIPQTGAYAAGVYGTHTGWHVASLADFDADGKADILWRFANSATVGSWVPGQTSLWFMNGATRSSGAPLPVQLGAYQNTTGGATPTGWLVAGAGDFNADGYTDILYRYAGANTATVYSGQTAVWLMQGKAATTPFAPLKMANGSNTAAVGDARGGGQTVDNAGVVVNAGAFTATSGWSVDGIGDFNGDGKDDVLWRYLGTGHTFVWTMNGRTVTASGFTTVYPGTTATWSSQIMRSVLDPQ